jgi:hypothetical protein
MLYLPIYTIFMLFLVKCLDVLFNTCSAAVCAGIIMQNLVEMGAIVSEMYKEEHTNTLPYKN